MSRQSRHGLVRYVALTFGKAVMVCSGGFGGTRNGYRGNVFDFTEERHGLQGSHG